jgi:hypothetical protein
MKDFDFTTTAVPTSEVNMGNENMLPNRAV